MAITLKDISKLSGVATSTVSYVLSGKGDEMKISAGTQAKIREIAKQNNYRSNLVAKSLRRRTTRTIGVIMNDLYSSWANEIMNGINDVFLPVDYQPLLGVTMFGSDREKKLINSFLELQVEGLLVQPVASSGEFYKKLPLITEVPIVFIGDAIADVDIKAVMLDPVQAGRDQVEMLYRQGHTKIACVTTDYESVQSCGRREGVLTRLTELGLNMPPEYLRVARTMSPDSDRQIAYDLLNLDNPPTAIAVFCDPIAINMLGVFHKEEKYDIAVVGCGDLPECRTELISLSSIKEPREMIGKKAAEYLLSTFANIGERDNQKLCLKGEAMERNSTIKRDNI